MGIFRVTSGLLLSGILPVFHASFAGAGIVSMLLALPALGLMVGVMQLILIERSFSLVTELPNRVLNWIGGRADLADQGALDRARIGMIGSTAALGKAGPQVAQLGGSGARAVSRLRGGGGTARIGRDRPTTD